MSSGNADSELYAVSKPVTANESPDNLSLTGSIQHHQALGSQTSADTPSAALADHTNSSQKLYVASYDACHWYHPDTTNKIIRLDREQIYIDTSVDGRTTNKQRYGSLGIYLSQGAAEVVGRVWLYDQLKAVEPDIHRPLPIQDNSRCEKVIWKTSPWTKCVAGSWVHSGSDIFKRVELAVSVKECAVNEIDPGVGEEEVENAVCGETEIVDLTDDGGSSRKRSDRELMGEIVDGSMMTAAQTGNGGYTPEQNTEERITQETTDEEAVFFPWSLKEGSS